MAGEKPEKSRGKWQEKYACNPKIRLDLADRGKSSSRQTPM